MEASESSSQVQVLEGSSAHLTATWLAFLASICAAAAVDSCFVNGSRRCARIPLYGKQMLLWVIAGLLFAIFVMQVMGAGAGGSWIYGYFLEYMLSMDNLFVFQLVFKAYATPEPQVDRALFWGIAAAVVLRLAFFAVGTEILQLGILARIFFGLLLVYSGWKAFSDSDEEEDPSKNLLVRCVARLLPLHDKYSDEPAFFVRVPRRTSTDLADHTAPAPSVVGASGGDGDGIRLKDLVDGEDAEVAARSTDTACKVTPLFLVVFTLAIIDVIFAVDSVTAKISSVTGFEPDVVSFFLNLSSSAFAMFVLRSLYLVVDMMTHMFRFLPYGVGAVLIFIGLKLIASSWFEVSMLLSSILILGLLLFAILMSVIMPESEGPGSEKEEPKTDLPEPDGL